MRKEYDKIKKILRKEIEVPNEIKQILEQNLEISDGINSGKYITVTQASEILGVDKAEMKEIVNQRNLKKYGETKYRYLLLKDDIYLLKHNI